MDENERVVPEFHAGCWIDGYEVHGFFGLEKVKMRWHLKEPMRNEQFDHWNLWAD